MHYKTGWKKSRNGFRRMYEPPDDYAQSEKPLRRHPLSHNPLRKARPQMNKSLPAKIAPGEVLPGVQICPFGTWPKAGKPDQVCDAAALAAVVDAWRAADEKEVLCDFEHKSEEESEFSYTAAAAWIANLRVDGARGLVGDFKFTEAGAKAVTDRALRFLSPVFMELSGVPTQLQKDHRINLMTTRWPHHPRRRQRGNRPLPQAVLRASVNGSDCRPARRQRSPGPFARP